MDESVSLFSETDHGLTPSSNASQIKAISMSDNKVLVVYCNGVKLKFITYEFENGNVQINPLDCNISIPVVGFGVKTDRFFTAEKITENKILIVTNNNSNYTYLTVINIINNTIIRVAERFLEDYTSYLGSSIGIINQNRFVITTIAKNYMFSSMYAHIYSFENNVLTKISTFYPSGYGAYSSINSLDDNKFLFIGTPRDDVYSSAYKGTLYCSIYNLENTPNELKKADIKVSNSDIKPLAFKISNTDILVVYRNYNSGLIYGIVLKIVNNTITYGTPTKLSDISTYEFSIAKNTDDEILIIFSNLYCLKCSINDLEITVNEMVELAKKTYENDLVFSTTTVGNKVFTAFCDKGTYPIGTFAFDTETRVSHQIELKDGILGVSKTKANKGDKIKVIIPERSDNNG